MRKYLLLLSPLTGTIIHLIWTKPLLTTSTVVGVLVILGILIWAYIKNEFTIEHIMSLALATTMIVLAMVAMYWFKNAKTSYVVCCWIMASIGTAYTYVTQFDIPPKLQEIFN